jgi:hypothetical protein
MSHVPLKPLHIPSSLSQAKLIQYARLSNETIISSLKPGEPGSLKVRPDGTIIDGHHRIVILERRGFDIETLPREIICRE